jgi:hypothetical protein
MNKFHAHVMTFLIVFTELSQRCLKDQNQPDLYKLFLSLTDNRRVVTRDFITIARHGAGLSFEDKHGCIVDIDLGVHQSPTVPVLIDALRLNLFLWSRGQNEIPPDEVEKVFSDCIDVGLLARHGTDRYVISDHHAVEGVSDGRFR